MTKCEVCDFKYPEHCDADINTGEPTDLDEIRKLDGMSGSEFAFLTKVENDEVLGNGVWSVDRNKSEDKTNEDAIN